MSKIVKFIIGNVATKVEGDIIPEVLIACTISNKFYIMKKRKLKEGGYRTYPKEVESKIQLFSKSFNTFPTGWIMLVNDIYEKNGYNVLWEDERTGESNVYDFKGVFPYDLRYYQEEAVEMFLERTRSVIQIGTGGGKTAIAMKITDRLKTNTLMVVPNLILLYQTCENFSGVFGKDNVGMVGAGEFSPNKITIATAQTLWARRDNQIVSNFLETVNLLILDECHHVGGKSKKKKDEDFKTWELGNTWFILCQKMINAKWRLGLSATPGKEGSLGRRLLEATIGQVGYKMSASELIKQGYLVPVRVRMITNEIPELDVISAYRPAYEENIIGNNKRNNMIANEAKRLIGEGRSILITVTRIKKHGQPLLDLMKGYDVEFLHGNSKNREKTLQKFKDKKLSCLITTVVRDGADIPVADVLIYAQAGKKDRTLIQRVGRVLRLAKNKKEALIIDFFDEDGKVLQEHSEARLDTYRSEESFIVEVE